jgi:hypothetical protein
MRSGAARGTRSVLSREVIDCRQIVYEKMEERKNGNMASGCMFPFFLPSHGEVEYRAPEGIHICA